jgi:glucose/arabinose dehydrogenase
VIVVRLDKNDKPIKSEVFAEGWLREGVMPEQRPGRNVGKVWGRPVDVLVMPDGALLVSDDTGNAIYRISYAHGG